MSAGNRTPLPGYLGRSGSVPLAVVPGVRSILAFWLGGAAAFGEVPPVPPSGGGAGWGRVSLKHIEIQLREELFPELSEEERAAILAAIAWCLK